MSASSLSTTIRRTILDQSMRAGVGHIGSALSIADLLAALYGGVLRVGRPRDPDRDRVVLSKGHAALALYATLAATDLIDSALLDTYCDDGSVLGAHPEHALDHVDFSTGSLGQGLSIAAGAALAARGQRASRRTFALLSDAECNEGAIWEAAMFAGHHRLASLVAIVDENGQQALGYTRDILDPGPARARWEAFGWEVHEVDGHDVAALTQTIDALNTTDGPPHVLLARTTFGKGVSFMERRIEWHYLPLDDELYDQARDELAADSVPL